MLLFLILVAISATQSSRAQDASSDIVMLPCNGTCATITHPLKRISGDSLPSKILVADGVEGDRYKPHYPEGLVDVEFTVQPDGHVADDISVVRVIGPPEFVAVTKRTVRTYLYEPAMVDGQAVAVSHRVMAFFNVSGEAEARASVVQAYADAGELLKNRQFDEAHDKLTEMLKLPSLTFYERGLIMYPLVLIAMQRQQYLQANRLSGLALAFGPENFSEAAYRGMIRSTISSSLAMGDLVGAVKSLSAYKKWKHFDPADPIINRVADVQKKLDALPSYGVDANIPDPVEGDGFRMFLYRRYFTFTNIKGKLDRLSTGCREKEAVSEISDKAEWAIPKNWSDCVIWVRGTPGTTFQVVQFSSPQSEKQ